MRDVPDPLPIFLTLLAMTVILLVLMIRDMGMFYWPHSRPLNAFQRARRKARYGDPKACIKCAEYLETGSGGAPQDSTAAIQYLHIAADIYGRMARDGDGWAALKVAEVLNHKVAPPDICEKADHAYRRALKINLRNAERGDLNGLAMAGYQLRYGLGTIADHDRAAEFLEAAAARGHAPSMTSLGELHLIGLHGKKPDPVKAAALFRQAALTGDAEAHERVADGYLNSIGEPASRELAYMWYAWAARKGRKEALRKLAQIEKSWTPRQLREVQARLQTWAPS